MKKVTGIGGIFFKAQDAEKLRDWYRQHLGIESDGGNGAPFMWRESENPDQHGMTIWTAFPSTTRYFDPSTQPFMINYRVANLEWLLAQLREAGVEIDPKVEDTEYGRFAWVMDPEGNRIELWEPPADTPSS